MSTFVGLVFITGGVTTSGSGSGKSIYSSTDGFVNEGPGFVGSGTGEGSGVASGKFRGIFGIVIDGVGAGATI